VGQAGHALTMPRRRAAGNVPRPICLATGLLGVNIRPVADALLKSPKTPVEHPAALTDALGAPVAPPPSFPAVSAPNRAALEAAITRWFDEAMVPFDWPAVHAAWTLAREGKARELIALDVEWSRLRGADPFADASRAVGRRQLSRLRPMRDMRVVQRYAAAVDDGLASAWHPIVFGVYAAVFNIALRPALISYAERCIEGFVRAGCGALPEQELGAAESALKARLPERLPPMTAGPFLPAR
jgi:UreF